MFAEQARSKFRGAVNLNALDSKRHLQMKQAFPSSAHWSHLLLLIAVPEHHLYHFQKSRRFSITLSCLDYSNVQLYQLLIALYCI